MNPTDKRNKTIETIAVAMALCHSDKDGPVPETELRAAIGALDPESIGVLWGITGVLTHAIVSKMPRKWVTQIHNDLIEAFACLCKIE